MLRSGLFFLDDRANALQQIGRSLGFLNGPPAQFEHLVDIALREETVLVPHLQPALDGLQIEDDRGQWLIELMGDGGTHFVHRIDAGHLIEFGLQVAQALFNLLAPAQVAHHADKVLAIKCLGHSDREIEGERGCHPCGAPAPRDRCL